MSVYARPTMATEIPASITTPDTVETRLGTLRFFDGLPDEATVQTVYDNLDFQRAVQAFLLAMPYAPHHALRTGFRAFGPDNRTILIAESLLDSRTLMHGANTETIYNFGWLDTHKGPLVVEVPPHVLGFINDFWGRFVVDVGNAGPDKGQGGKYLLLPRTTPARSPKVTSSYAPGRTAICSPFAASSSTVTCGAPSRTPNATTARTCSPRRRTDRR
nr:DUF1254 domain-containing protein [Raineyella fluvialis]